MQPAISKLWILVLGAAMLTITTLPTARAAEPAASQAVLVAALSKSKLTLADAIRQAAKTGDVAISAKFEFDDAGKLSLSVYTAERGAAERASDSCQALREACRDD